MRIARLFPLLLSLALVGCLSDHTNTDLPTNHKDVKRVGMVVKLKPDQIGEYNRIHSDEEPGVRHLLEKYGMRNFSIFLVQLADSNWYEFAYYEYWGDDFEADMEALAEEPENLAWLSVTDSMQEGILPGIAGWKEMDRIFYNY